MHRTLKLKLDVNEGQKAILFRTMELYDKAFKISAQWGFQNHNSNKIDNHKATYRTVREMYPELPSYFVEGARDYACELLKALECKKCPRRTPKSPILYHRKAGGVCLRSGYAKLSTVSKRIKITFHLGKYHEKYLDWDVRSSNLMYDRGLRSFFLCVTVETTNDLPRCKGPVMGIDRGIVNIAVTSANQFFNSKEINRVRGQYTYLRAQLQSKGTRSAKRKLRKMSGRERRFKADMNHRIAKEIVNAPYGVFALEDLKGISTKKMKKKRGAEWARRYNEKLSSWNYSGLEQMIRYKAEELGKSVIVVPGRFTSIRCSECGHKAKASRVGNEFHCVKCGFQLHADLNASRNIARLGISEMSRLSVNQPNMTPSEI